MDHPDCQWDVLTPKPPKDSDYHEQQDGVNCYQDYCATIYNRWKITILARIVGARREQYNGMDGIHIILAYSANEDSQVEHTHMHVTYWFLKRYLSHRMIGFIMLGIKANGTVAPQHKIDFHKWVCVPFGV